MRRRAWLVYPILASLATVVYYATGHDSYLFNLIGLSSPILIAVAVVVHKPSVRLPWYLFALGQFLFITGDVLAYNYDKIFGGDLPFPAISDVAYLLVYPCLVAGALFLVRCRAPRRDLGTFVDSAIIAIGTGTLSWMLLISPYAHDTTLTGLQKFVAMGYPIMDLLLFTVTIRLAMGAGRKTPAFTLMLTAVAALLLTDSVYGWMQLNSGYTPGSGWLEIGWITFYVLFGAAALHPSMRRVSDPGTTERVRTVSSGRLVLLGAASLLAPIAEGIQAWRHQPLDLPVALGATIILFVLAIVRMAGFVREQQLSISRERALREAGEALETATSRDGIYQALTSAARSLLGAAATIRLYVATGATTAFALTASTTARDDEGTDDEVLDLGGLDAETRDGLRAGHSQWVRRDGSHATAAFDNDDRDLTYVSPILVRDALFGVLTVTSASSLTATGLAGLEALSSQVALALESAVLTEELLVQQSEARFASLVKNSSDVIVLIDRDTTIRYASPAASSVLGYEPSDLEGRTFASLVHAGDAKLVASFTFASSGRDHPGPFEFRLRCADDRYIFVEALRTNLEQDPNVRGIVLNIRDVSERKSFEEQLSHQAFHDTLTGLANRALFQDRVAHAIERRSRDARPVAVLFVDLDDFKTINDSLGHTVGDRVLKECGERLRSCLRPADTPARLGGDEFAILLEDDDETTYVDIAERIMEVLATPFQLDDREVLVRASIGIATTDAGPTPDVENAATEDLLRNADLAMYFAKEQGKSRYQLFEPTMHSDAVHRLELKADLQRALDNNEFELHYQPLVEITNGEICGFEALIRWQHPERGTVAPLDFIPLAEETGLIMPIGHWVLREACAFAASVRAEMISPRPLHVAVNLSPRQLQRPEIVDQVREVLFETGLDPGALILEITESAMMTDMNAGIRRLTDFKELGVQLAIDDFGTGYSSLNYVRQFPVDILKIDKSFVDGLANEDPTSSLVATVIDLARVMNLHAVAEGVEDAGQLQRLRDLDCEFAQGYLFARPMQGPALVRMLREESERTIPT